MSNRIKIVLLIAVYRSRGVGDQCSGPKVEGVTTFEIEASVVPMTGQDAVLDATALKRETHVRAPIVECEDAPAVVDDEDWTVMSVHKETPLGLQLLKAPSPSEFLVGRVRKHTSRGRPPSCRDLNIGTSRVNVKGRFSPHGNERKEVTRKLRWFRGWNVGTCPRSVRLDTRELDYLGPFIDVFGNELVKLVWRVRRAPPGRRDQRTVA